jgi:hypothetical protein
MDFSEWGLELVFQSEAYDYEWDIFTVFKETETGYFFWINESGCSCNSPLEDIYSKADFTRGTKQELMLAFSNWLGSEEGFGYSLKPSGGDRTRDLAEIAKL